MLNSVREPAEPVRRGQLREEERRVRAAGGGCWEPGLWCWGQVRWRRSEKRSCCRVKHFTGFCLVRHKLPVCVLAARVTTGEMCFWLGSLHLPGFAVRISQEKA